MISARKQYRFGFNGMEKSPEIHDSHYTAKFWEYDSRIGRRWNLDPVDQISISNYAVMGNNPILHTDPLGDKWGDDAAKAEAKEVKKDLKTAIKTTRSFVTEGYVDKADGKARIEDLKSGIKEIKAMGKSKAHTFYTNSNSNVNWIEAKGNNEYVLNYKLNNGFKDVGVRAHEFKHGYQYMTGKLSQDYDYYDLTDEIEGFKRQFSTFTDLSNWGLPWDIQGRDGTPAGASKP